LNDYIAFWRWGTVIPAEETLRSHSSTGWAIAGGEGRDLAPPLKHNEWFDHLAGGLTHLRIGLEKAEAG